METDSRRLNMSISPGDNLGRVASQLSPMPLSEGNQRVRGKACRVRFVVVTETRKKNARNPEELPLSLGRPAWEGTFRVHFFVNQSSSLIRFSPFFMKLLPWFSSRFLHSLPSNNSYVGLMSLGRDFAGDGWHL